jgi:hypothetical protein
MSPIGASTIHDTYLSGFMKAAPKGSHLVAQAPLALLYMFALFAAALFVALLLRRFFSSTGPPDSSSNGGGGGASPRVPRGPGPGGVPLDDAQPARVRLRDDRPLARRLPARQRRATREPARTPTRVLWTSGELDRRP